MRRRRHRDGDHGRTIERDPAQWAGEIGGRQSLDRDAAGPWCR